MKLYPPCGYRSDSDLLKPFYEYCEAHRLPVLIHIGPTSPALSFSEAMPMYVDMPAMKYGNIDFILAHGATNYTEQCIQLCRYRPNVYMDVSGVQAELGESFQRESLRRTFCSGINHKIIFGTDWPINNYTIMNRKLLNMLEDEDASGLSCQDARLVLGGNIERILAKRMQ